MKSSSGNRFNPHQYAYHSTRRLHLAAFIKGAKLLEFSHTERAADGKCVFVFHDERREGETFEKAYEQGDGRSAQFVRRTPEAEARKFCGAPAAHSAQTGHLSPCPLKTRITAISLNKTHVT